MVEDKVSQAIDYGTRQWTPEDDLHSARMGLQRRLDRIARAGMLRTRAQPPAARLVPRQRQALRSP